MKKAWLALVFGSALFLAACGGNDDQDTTTPPEDDNANNTEDVANEDATPNENAVDEGTVDEGTTTDEEATDDEGATDEGATDEEATDGADEATLAKGEELVQKNCLSCHGQNLEGVGSFPAIKGLTAEEVLTAIEEGPGSMPANLLKGEDAEAAAAYLATVK